MSALWHGSDCKRKYSSLLKCTCGVADDPKVLTKELATLREENERLDGGICKAGVAINKIIKRDVFEPMDKEDYDELLDWLKEYGKE